MSREIQSVVMSSSTTFRRELLRTQWVFTLNNYTDQEFSSIKSILKEKSKYSVIGEEVSSRGTPHLQGYVDFKEGLRFKGVKDIIGNRAHIEPAYGSPAQNYKYCTKDNRFWECGTLPALRTGTRDDDEPMHDIESSTNMTTQQSPCELNDWEWLRIKQDFQAPLAGAAEGPIGVAIIGLGRMGSIHMKNVLAEPRASLLYCLDGDQSRLEFLSSVAQFKDTKIIHSSDFQAALDDQRVHIVIIATPTSFHESLVRRSLAAKKNVLCEKPLTTTWSNQTILGLYELAEAQQVFLVTAFNRHYDPDWRRMRQLSIGDQLGAVQLIRIVSRNGGLPNMAYLSTSGGIFHDTCIHDLAMMLWLSRRLPASVQVTGRTWKQFYESERALVEREIATNENDMRLLQQLDDYFMVVISLQFADGSIGVIESARYSSYGNDQRCEIYGAKGMIKADGRLTSNVDQWNESGVHNVGINYNFASRYATAYKAELEDMLTMAELTRNGKYFNWRDRTREALGRSRVVEYSRGSLVAAAAHMAGVCWEAVKSAKSVQFNWSSELRARFEAEIRM